MAKTIALAILIVTALLAGCGEDVDARFASFGYEDGMRTGHADMKALGYCDKPFPKERSQGTLYHSPEYFKGFETGYYKGCGLARKTKPLAPTVKKSLPPTTLCVPPPLPPRPSLQNVSERPTSQG